MRNWLVILMLAGCAGKLFYLPGTGESEWSQAGRSAEHLAFCEAGPDPPVQLRWEQKLDAAPVGGALVDGQLLLQPTTGPALCAFDRYSGQRLGKRGYSAPMCGPPVLSGWLLVLAEAGPEPAVRGFDRRDGQIRWSYPGLACAPLVGRNDTLIAALASGEVAALRSGDGARLWQKSTEGRLWAAPAIGRDGVYAGDGKGRLVALALCSGQEQWRQELGGGLQAVVVSEGRIFAATAAGMVLALDAGTGEIHWQTRLGASPTPGMALAGQVLAVGAADHGIYGIDRDAGQVAWQFRTGGVVRGAPASTSRTVYCGSSDGYLYALESGSGRLVWKYPLDGPALQPVTIGRDLVAIATEEGTIYVFGK